MTEFKKGDRIRYTGENRLDEPILPRGEYTFNRIREDWPTDLYVDELDRSYATEDFELVTSTTSVSTEIKPGQIWERTGDGTLREIVAQGADSPTWWDVRDPDSDDEYTFWLREDYIRRNYTLRQDATAPLDPTLVKAGDTVTVTRPATSVVPATYSRTFEGVVDAVFQHTDGSIGFAIAQMTFYLGEHWTLTAHTPAPEPEPEWKPGTPGKAVVGGDPEPVWYIGHREWMDAHGQLLTNPQVSFFRPDVVLDPEEAKAALADLVVSNRDGNPDGWVEAHESTIWAALGIEAK